jgi:cell division protein FtsB
LIRRVLLGIVVLAVLWFAVQGGQWGTWDLWRQRRDRQQLQHELDSLQHRVDSLKRYRTRLDTDRALQEKLARENVGMVRGDKELLYLISPDSSARKPPEDRD